MSYIQDIGNKAAGFTANWSVNVTTAPSAGNTLMFEVQWNGNGTAATNALTDSKGNTWTRVNNARQTTVTMNLQLWYTNQDVATLTTSDTLTMAFTAGNTNSISAVIREYGGQIIPDQTTAVNSTTSGTSLSVGPTATTTSANETVVAIFTTGTVQTSATPDASYSVPTRSRYSDGNNAHTLLSEYRDIVSTGTQTATYTTGATTAGYLGIIATFMSAVSPPTNTSAPTISGVAQVGNDLIGTPGSWTG